MFLEHRCPNRPKSSGEECRSMLGGPAIESLKQYDFITPFIDYRYCPKCRTLWKITIKTKELNPEYELVDRNLKVDSIQPYSALVIGNRRKKNG